jgi:hypothetical protein
VDALAPATTTHSFPQHGDGQPQHIWEAGLRGNALAEWLVEHALSR